MDEYYEITCYPNVYSDIKKPYEVTTKQDVGTNKSKAISACKRLKKDKPEHSFLLHKVVTRRIPINMS